MNPHLNIEMWGTRDHEKLSKLISEGDGDNDIQIKVNRHWIAVLMGLLIQLAVAQSTTASRTNAAFPRFTQTEGNLDSDGLPTSGAKLCVLGRRDICYQMPSQQAPGELKVIYQFGLDPRSERLPLFDGGSWVCFTGTFSGGGSGTLERLAVLRFEGSAESGKIINLLPFLAVTNVSDRAMWTIPSASEYPILVRADFIWGDGETHLGLHYHTVEAWLFDLQSDHYVKAFSYRTKRRYDSGDSGKPVHILKAERQEIVRMLEAK